MPTPSFVSRFGLVAVLVVLCQSCAPSLQQNPPREARRDVPGGFGADTAGAPAKTASKTAPAGAAQRTWREMFGEPELQALIAIALKNNQELNIQLQEIIVAKNEIMARKGEYLPKVDAGVGVGVDKVGTYTSQGVSDEAHDVANPLGNWQFGFSATWEVDIWKKLRNAAKAATLRYLASVEGRNLVVTRLVAEIANSYYELTALDNRLEVLKRNIEIQQSALEVVKLQKEAGRVTQLAVQRFEAEVLKNQSRQFDLEQQIVQTENRINFLVGRYPQPVARASQHFNDALPPTLQTGVPSDLLQNRPDVRQAELQLEAAKLDVKVAKAQFYPSLTIDAGLGYQAFNPKHLVTTPESLIAGIAGSISAPLLNRQAIKAEYLTANAQQIKAVFNYERTLLEAFTDVVNQLANIKNLQQSYDLEAKQVDLLTQSIDVSNVLFQAARADYMEVLLTRRDALDSQMELIETRLRQRLAMVAVYQALGGGWRDKRPAAVAAN